MYMLVVPGPGVVFSKSLNYKCLHVQVIFLWFLISQGPFSSQVKKERLKVTHVQHDILALYTFCFSLDV